MKHYAVTTAFAVLLLAAPSLAQVSPTPAPAPAAPMTPPPAATAPVPMSPAPMAPAAQATRPAPAGGMIQYIAAQKDGEWLATNFMGQTVRGPNNEDIGEINDLVVDKDGRVSAAIIGVGGFLGIGEKDVAVPFSSLTVSNERDEVITLAATKEQLQSAPEYKTLDDVDSERRASEVRTTPPAVTAPPAAPAPRPAQ